MLKEKNSRAKSNDRQFYRFMKRRWFKPLTIAPLACVSKQQTGHEKVKKTRRYPCNIRIPSTSCSRAGGSGKATSLKPSENERIVDLSRTKTSAVQLTLRLS